MRVAQTLLSTIAELRMAKGLKQRQPVPQILVASDSHAVKKTLRTYSTLLREQANSRRLKLVSKNSAHKLDDPQRFANTDFSEGAVFLDLKLTKSEIADGLARDAVRRMQQMRKEMDLKVDSFVHAYVITPSRKEAALLKSRRGYIAGEVRAIQIRITTGEMKIQLPFYTKRWQINGATFEFGLCETSKLTRKTSAGRNLATTGPQ
jgi:isoleucyl-tRNA synthetase